MLCLEAKALISKKQKFEFGSTINVHFLVHRGVTMQCVDSLDLEPSDKFLDILEDKL